MNCEICNKILRSDNKIGYCRAHRAFSPNRKSYMLIYSENNKNKILNIKRKHYPKATKRAAIRMKTDPQFKLRHTLRNRLNSALRRRGKEKFSAVKNLGCSIQELKSYLEKLFKPGMTWENHGKWHIDHIKPLALFDLSDEAQIKEACHYKNLQPLWAFENIKKRDRI